MAVKVRGLVRRYTAKCVLEGVDLDIAPGEFVALLGRSGSCGVGGSVCVGGHHHRDRGDDLRCGAPGRGRCVVDGGRDEVLDGARPR